MGRSSASWVVSNSTGGRLLLRKGVVRPWTGVVSIPGRIPVIGRERVGLSARSAPGVDAVRVRTSAGAGRVAAHGAAAAPQGAELADGGRAGEKEGGRELVLHRAQALE